jgi:hypothetical protein
MDRKGTVTSRFPSAGNNHPGLTRLLFRAAGKPGKVESVGQHPAIIIGWMWDGEKRKGILPLTKRAKAQTPE